MRSERLEALRRKRRKRKIQRAMRAACITAALLIATVTAGAAVLHSEGTEDAQGQQDDQSAQAQEVAGIYAQTLTVSRKTAQNAEKTEKAENPTEAEENAAETPENEATETSDEYLLAKLAMAEAEGEPIEGKLMVIRTVLNRVEDPDFPNTVEEVIFQEGQFEPVEEGGRWWTVEPDDECMMAAAIAMAGWDKSDGALYFEAVSNGTDTWHSRNLTYIATVGNHNFYK